MRSVWLKKQNNKNIAVFFNGWGSIKPPDKFALEGCDILMFNDYCSFEPVNIDFSGYEKKYLAAWSLGVYVSSYYYETFNDFDRLMAVNGTLKPVDDNYGIPQKAYDMTIDNFNELTCRKFMQKIGAPLENIEGSIDRLKAELISIRDLKIKQFLPFKRAFISKRDRIFPYKNMKAFWEKQGSEIIEIDEPHYFAGIFEKQCFYD